MALPEEPPTSPARRSGRSGPVVPLVIDGSIEPAHLPELERRVRACSERDDAVVIDCDVSALTRPDVATVDVLARLQVTARRGGKRIRLVGASAELLALLDCVGLTDALPAGRPSGGRLGREAEEREEPGCVQEEADPDDLAL